tara:strand:- start:43 stop:1062 length:1020 start_codon:yes stop_codon:yes gene_type:complete
MSITKRYAEYIESPGWAAKAQSAKQRAGQKCQLCGAKRKDVKLHAHHNTYQRLGREKNTDLLVLCEPCHAKHHDKLPKPDGEQLPLDSTNGAVDAIESVMNAVTLPEWDTMSDDEKVADARWLCAAAEKKMDVQPPHIARKVAERIGCGASTYGNYRRGLCVLRSNYQRHGYRYVRDVLSHYLNTGEWKQTELPALTARQIEYNGAYKEKNAAAEKRLADIEDRITANNTQFKSWKTRTGNAYDTTNGKLQSAVAEQHDQRVRLNKAISECVRLDKRIDFVDKAGNRSFDRQDVEIIKLHQRLDGLAEANKLLLQKLEATTEPAPPTELSQWWDRLWSR